MDVVMVNIALIVTSADDRAFYVRQLKRVGVAIEEYPSVAEFKSACRGRVYSGIVTELKTAFLADSKNKLFLSALADSFPMMRIHRVDGPDSFTGLVGNRGLSGEELIQCFLATCRDFPPRGVRVATRRAKCVLNARVSPSLSDQGTRVSATDISVGGMFVVMHEVWQEDRIFVRIEELRDPTPIECEVRWQLPWGVSNVHLPGIGLRIVSMTEAQQEQWARLVSGDDGEVEHNTFPQ